MNTLARIARMNATPISHHTRFPTATCLIARKSTLTQVFSDKVVSRNTDLLPSESVSASLLICFAATGPHSQAIKANGFVFVSGQIPVDTKGVLSKGGVREQAVQMIGNVGAVLEDAGSVLEKVVKVNVSAAVQGVMRMRSDKAERN